MSDDSLQKFIRKTWGIAGILVGIGFIGFVLFLVKKVQNGEGLDHYISGMGYELSYLSALMFVALIPIIIIVVLIIAWFQESDERDFKRKYLRRGDKTQNK